MNTVIGPRTEKTAMQQLINMLHDMVDNGGDPDLLCAITHAENYLPIEKQQIIDAYWGGIEGTMNDWSEAKEEGSTITGIKTGGGAEKYYNDNFTIPNPQQ